MIGLTIDQMWSGGLNINLDRIKLLVILVCTSAPPCFNGCCPPYLTASGEDGGSIKAGYFNRLTDLPIADIDRHLTVIFSVSAC